MQNSSARNGQIKKRSRPPVFAAIAAILLSVPACEQTTGKLSQSAEQQFAGEGIARRADDLTFRYTHDVGRRDTRWENRRASIVVTRESLLIHKNDKVGLLVTPRTRRNVEIAREGERVRIRAGSGRSQEVWSFQPPSDPAGWATDIRAMLKTSQNPGR